MGTLPQNNDKSPERDACQTPSYGLEPLLFYLDALQLKLGRQLIVWESAAGEGLLAEYLERAGYDVIATDYSTNRSYLGEGVMGGRDRFLSTDSYPRSSDYDVEVTNVPFSRKFEWLKAMIDSGRPGALLMPSNTRFTAGGSNLVRQYLIQLLSPIQRIDFKMPNKGWGDEDGDSTAQFHTSWWTRGLNLGDAIVDVDILKSGARLKKLRSGWMPRLGVTEYDQYLLNKPVKVSKLTT